MCDGAKFFTLGPMDRPFVRPVPEFPFWMPESLRLKKLRSAFEHWTWLSFRGVGESIWRRLSFWPVSSMEFPLWRLPRPFPPRKISAICPTASP